MDRVERFEPASAITVSTSTLDSYCSQHNVQPDLVKIDVEGAEWSVIEGAYQTIESYSPVMRVEVFKDSAHKDTLWSYFSGLNYRVFAVPYVTRQPFRYVKTMEEFSSMGDSDYVLFADTSLDSAFNALAA
jgi:hypothetical protein